MFSTFNFVIFDILLLSILFWLTSDITGLINSACALQQQNNRMRILNVPLVGLGLTSSRRDVFWVMTFVRGIALACVCATNFTIQGVSCERVQHVTHDVVVQADRYLKNVSIEFAKAAILRRRSCTGHKDDYHYYGEIRLDGYCETRKELFSTSTVNFYTQFFNRTIDFPKGGCEFYTDNNYHVHIHRFTCSGLGTIGCLISTTNNNTIPSTCLGVVMADDARHGKEGKVAYMCEGEALFPGRFGMNRTVTQARCRMAENANVTNPFWVPMIHNTVRTLPEVIDAIYGIQVKRMQVKIPNPNDRIDVTQFDRTWFVILGIMCILIALLTGVDLRLRALGLVPAGNNESKLAALLAAATPNGTAVWNDGIHTLPPPNSRPSVIMLMKENGTVRAQSLRTGYGYCDYAEVK